MNKIIIGYSLVIVIIASCLVWTANADYAIDDMDSIIEKRKYKRRSFLKSFCQRRCNQGYGGNVCRCNGFHFAGKRTAPSAADELLLHRDDDNENSHEFLYKVLSEKDKILLDPTRYEEGSGTATDRQLRKAIDSYIPNILRDTLNDREFDPMLDRLLNIYLASDDIDM